ncbi:MAG: hypothetical protein KAS32_18435 [Candidatus Peribacteraceae bacterium]|nr:hypothetical protein [Candidatus Peribacteraceae bacterium]
MAILGQVSQASSIFNDAANFAKSFTQPQVSISEKPPIPGLRFPKPSTSNNTVIFEVVETEDMTLATEITRKPVADLGAAIDYISRNPPEFSMTGIISNRNLNILSDPIGFALSKAGAAFPQIASAINTAVGVANTFVDLGGDEIDNKIKQLYQWQVNGVFINPLGLRLDINNWIQDTDKINWLIESINPRSDLDAGDGVAFDIGFVGMIGVSDEKSASFGSFLQDLKGSITSLGGLNPFG